MSFDFFHKKTASADKNSAPDGLIAPAAHPFGARRFSATSLVYPPIGAALIAVCSWIAVPAPVPFTMQTFAVFFLLAWMGGRRGLCAIALYLALGAIGLPVFASFGGGIGTLIGPTGGYLLGFLLTGLVFLAMTAIGRPRLWIQVAALVFGLFLCYAFGTGWYLVVLSAREQTVALGGALMQCVLPFLLPDLLKLALALMLARRIPHPKRH